MPAKRMARYASLGLVDVAAFARGALLTAALALGGFGAALADQKAPHDQPPGTFVAQAGAAQPLAAAADYRIGPNDVLNVTVFQVKDLSLEKVVVDANGQILLPLVGTVAAGGRTASELSSEIARRLGEKYLQDPQVTVLVTEAASQQITVGGAVTQPGVFPVKGRTTLLQAIALARGTNNNANLHKVAVFRNAGGKQAAAVFNLRDIEAGKAEDPALQGNDIVMVDNSAGKSAWHELIQTLPALSVFALLP